MNHNLRTIQMHDVAGNICHVLAEELNHDDPESIRLFLMAAQTYAQLSLANGVGASVVIVD